MCVHSQLLAWTVDLVNLGWTAALIQATRQSGGNCPPLWKSIIQAKSSCPYQACKADCYPDVWRFLIFADPRGFWMHPALPIYFSPIALLQHQILHRRFPDMRKMQPHAVQSSLKGTLSCCFDAGPLKPSQPLGRQTNWELLITSWQLLLFWDACPWCQPCEAFESQKLRTTLCKKKSCRSS